MFDELVACKNITAVKESTRDVTNVTRMRNRFGDRYQNSLRCGYHWRWKNFASGLMDGWPDWFVLFQKKQLLFINW